MLPDLLRDSDVGLLLVRSTATHLEVIDANRAAVSLLRSVDDDVRGRLRPRLGLGQVIRLPEAVHRALGGEKSHWCTLVNLDGGPARHLNVCVMPFDDVPFTLALVQLADLPRRQDACVERVEP